jgi:hypothetical protein
MPLNLSGGIVASLLMYENTDLQMKQEMYLILLLLYFFTDTLFTAYILIIYNHSSVRVIKYGRIIYVYYLTITTQFMCDLLFFILIKLI